MGRHGVFLLFLGCFLVYCDVFLVYFWCFWGYFGVFLVFFDVSIYRRFKIDAFFGPVTFRYTFGAEMTEIAVW